MSEEELACRQHCTYLSKSTAVLAGESRDLVQYVVSQFVLAGIAMEITKFHHVVSALQLEELGIVGDIILNPPEVKPYAALRTTLFAIC
ncbi:hypothetical protein TNIN_150781 [Trichonephila inaurata madagascariensis]|uniref:DUF7041 domain-containing protein n=1 Tax=Trichonephila inaurata madagascariensis TaxID=2747483 RepID=A0A8X7CBT4_9ARAC|nr:hypothetical protein TNIN_150781 [Trichonephila inaurata madagascariensis]